MIQESPSIPSDFFASGSTMKDLVQIFLQVPAGITVFNGPSFIIEFVNDSAVEIWGKKRQELLGNPLFAIFPELLPSNLAQVMNAVYAKGEKFEAIDYELSFVKPEQRVTRYVDLVINPVAGSATPRRIIATISETTGEVRNRKKIIESEERFRALANGAPLLVWVTGENLQTTYINKTGLGYFGLEDSYDLTLLSWKKFIHPDDLDRVLETMSHSAKKHVPYTLEMRLRNGATGEYRWFLDKGIPQYNNDTFVGFIGNSLDIQDRKEAEKILEDKVKERTAELDNQNRLLTQQNDLIKNILDSTLDIIALCDRESRIVTVNQSALNLSGLAEDDVVGKELLNVFPQFVNTQGRNDLARALRGETIHNEIYQSPITGKYYENFLMPLYTDDHSVYAVLAIAHDNTNLINKNKELNEAQQIAQLGSWDWNLATNEVNWSEQMYHIYGYSQEKFAVSFEKAVERMLPEDIDKTRERMSNQVREAKKIFEEKGELVFHIPTYEYPISLPDGTQKSLRGAGKIVLSPDGAVNRVIGTVLDITEQKKSEQQLIETMEKLDERNQFVEKLINASLDLIVVVDREFRFMVVNKKAESVIRSYYREEIVGKTLFEVNPTVKDSDTYQDLLNAFEGNIIIRDRVKSSISENYYEHNYVPLPNAYGSVYAVMIISHDITENIRQMAELKKLNESDKLKSDFIKMASHELKTPITSIKGYVQLLLSALDKGAEKEPAKLMSPLLIKSSLVSIDKQTSRLTRLMSELLDLSKIETGRLELQLELFSINEIVIETVQDILYTHSKHEINIFHDFGCSIYGDKDRIGQVLINFITNAIKYSPQSDKIEIWVRRSPGNSVSVDVKDYGIGIDKKDQERIFERFYRVPGKMEQTFPGFGIGLFIAREIIQRHNGTISLESEKGKGSVFTFRLPIATEQKEQNE